MNSGFDFRRSWYLEPASPHPCALAVKWTAFRNLEGWPFPAHCDTETLKALFAKVSEVLQKIPRNFAEQVVWESSTPLVQSLAQERFLTMKTAKRHEHAVSWFWKHQSFDVHWGGDEHLSFGHFSAGGDVVESFAQFADWEEELAVSLGFAYRSGWGWVNTDPRLAGAGLVPAVLLHLPASAASGLWAAMMKTVERRGFSLNPVWAGPGGESDFFWLRGDFSFGRSSIDLSQTLQDLLDKITKGEAEAQRRELVVRRIDVEDSVGRAWGLLTNARRLSWEEALAGLSALRRAKELDIIIKRDWVLFDRLFFRLQSAQLRSLFLGSAGDEDVQRATVARRLLLDREDACLKD